MRILSKDRQRGFTLIEVIATIVVAGVVGAMTFSFFGKSFVESPKPVSNLNKALGLQAVMENINQDYTRNYAGSDTALSSLKTKIGSENSTYSNTYGSYKLIYNRFIKFNSTGGTESTMMPGQNLLKVTVQQTDTGERLTALFSSGGASGSGGCCGGSGNCGGGSGCSCMDISSVSITPVSPSIATGATQQFTATVNGCSSNTGVTWSVTAGEGSINADGLYTAPATAGQSTVKATSKDCSNKYGTVTVTVTADCSSDTTAPAVSSKSPATDATGVTVNSHPSVTFSEAMDSNTINDTTFTVSGVSGSVSYDNNTKTATFTPLSPLAYSTTYTATITAGVKDACGNAISSNYSWSFTTAASGGGDTTPPTVSSTYPTNGTMGYMGNINITATFSEAMDPTTINNSTFTLSGGVTGTVTYNSATRTATFDPASNLSCGTQYTATITTGVKDTAGNAMQSYYTWWFKTKGMCN